jgi:hypothetical protein
MMPAFVACTVREIHYLHILPERWSWVLLLVELIFLLATPFWALDMCRGFLTNREAAPYLDEVREDAERVRHSKDPLRM